MGNNKQINIKNCTYYKQRLKEYQKNYRESRRSA